MARGHDVLQVWQWILHDWDDDNNIRLLKNCHNALPTNGKVIVVEYLLLEITNLNKLHDKLTFHFDLLMLVSFGAGAQERIEHEMQQLALAVGFAQVNLIVDTDSLSNIEMHKDL